jgi:AraC family transcriptional regulator
LNKLWACVFCLVFLMQRILCDTASLPGFTNAREAEWIEALSSGARIDCPPRDNAPSEVSPASAARTRLAMHGPRGEILPALDRRPIYGSFHLPWDGIVLERYRLQPGAVPPATAPAHILAIPMSRMPHNSVTWRIENKTVRGRMEPGQAHLRAASESFACAWSAPVDILFLSVTDPAIAWACDLLKVKGEQTLRSYLALDDNDLPNHELAQIALRLDECVQGHNHNGSLYEESLLLALSLKLVMLYRADGRSHILPPRSGALPPGKLAAVQEYIWSHISQSLSLDGIAQAVSMSTYHLSHQFRAAMSIPLWRYVRACRATYARRLMARHPGIPLSGIASASGFESYSAFYNAFHKTHGVTPSQFAPL